MELINIDNSAKQELVKLSQDFDCFGLPSINVNVDVVDQLIISVTGLMRLYRKSLTKIQECSRRNTQLEEELHMKRKMLDSSKDHIKDLENDLKKQSNASFVLQSEANELKSRLEECERDLKRSKIYIKNRDSEWSHKVARLQGEVDKCNDKSLKGIGHFQGQDEQLVRTIAQYKIKEDIYKDTIQQLQANNDKLQVMILDLKDDVLTITHNQDSARPTSPNQNN